MKSAEDSILAQEKSVYESFFGLNRKPFELVPNPAFMFMSSAHKKAYNYLSYGIMQQSGFILLTGEVGTGKTTLVRGLIKSQLKDVMLSKVFNTRVHSCQLLEMILDDFGVKPQSKAKPALLRELNDFLIAQYSKGRQCVLIIDEAQNLTKDLLEEVRLLSNLESDSQKLLRIILAGQPELSQLLASPDLLQLRQRIQVSCHIPPLKESEIGEYIAHRLEAAGNREAVAFEPGAHEAIALYTRAVPRLINILCDYLLLDAFANETKTISVEAVHEVASDLNFDNQYWNPPAQAEPAELAQKESKASTSPTILATSKVTSYLKHMNGRLKTIEEMIPHLESEPKRAASIDQKELMSKLGAIQKGLQGRLDEMWSAVGAIAEEVHDLRQNLESRRSAGELSVPASSFAHQVGLSDVEDTAMASAIKGDRPEARGGDPAPPPFEHEEAQGRDVITSIKLANDSSSSRGWLFRLFSRMQ